MVKPITGAILTPGGLVTDKEMRRGCVFPSVCVKITASSFPSLTPVKSYIIRAEIYIQIEHIG